MAVKTETAIYLSEAEMFDMVPIQHFPYRRECFIVRSNEYQSSIGLALQAKCFLHMPIPTYWACTPPAEFRTRRSWHRVKYQGRDADGHVIVVCRDSLYVVNVVDSSGA